MADLEAYALLRYSRASQGGWRLECQPDVQTWVCLKRLADNAPSVMGSDTLVLRADDLYTEEDK
jgi:hypothetical protein